jgi:hypothetical protein
MRLVWVSFDVMGRDCLAAAAEAGAEGGGCPLLLDVDRPSGSARSWSRGRLGLIGPRT